MRVFSYVPSVGYVLMFVAPFIGFGLLRLKKWAYFLFLAHAAAIVLFNVYSLFAHQTSYYGMSLLRSVLGLAMLWYALRREISAPYLSLIPRGFRRYVRRSVETGVFLQGVRFVSRDLSPAGVFLKKPDAMKEGSQQADVWKALQAGVSLQLRLPTNTEELSLSGRIVYKNDQGLALRFAGMPSSTRSALKRFLEVCFPARYDLELSVVLRTPQGEISGRSLDVSERGLYFVPDQRGVALPAEGTEIEINLDEQKFSGCSRVAWENPKGRFGRSAGFGLQLLSISTPRRFRRELKKAARKKHALVFRKAVSLKQSEVTS